MNTSIVAIGDIHGCRKSLESLWEKLEPHKDALHVFIGDYIDRGPDSRGVVDFLLEKRDERECVFLRGNHESMLLNAYETGEAYNWMLNGGDATLQSYGENIRVTELPDEHLDFYEETLPYFETEDYFFVHAGVPPHKSIEQSKSNPRALRFFLWGRDHLTATETEWEKTVIFGHTPKPDPIMRNGMIGIDTGCVYKRMGLGKLTAVLLPDTIFIQQVSLD
jgi:serine/threonine protein phosphatase 1